MKKKYINPDFKKGYPGDKNIFYECEICKDVVESRPTQYLQCKCGNIRIDPDFGRMAIKDDSQVKVFEER